MTDTGETLPIPDIYVITGRSQGQYIVEYNGSQHVSPYTEFGLVVHDDPRAISITRVDHSTPRFWRNLATYAREDSFNIALAGWHPTLKPDPGRPWTTIFGAGINLTIEEGWALRDALDVWLTGDEQQQGVKP